MHVCIYNTLSVCGSRSACNKCMYAYVYIYVYMHLSLSLYPSLSLSIYIYVYCMCICMCIYIYIYIYMYIHITINILYIHIHTCTYTYTYTHTCIYTPGPGLGRGSRASEGRARDDLRGPCSITLIIAYYIIHYIELYYIMCLHYIVSALSVRLAASDGECTRNAQRAKECNEPRSGKHRSNILLVHI